MEEKDDPYWDDEKPIVELMRYREQMKEKLKKEKLIREAEASVKKASAPRAPRASGGGGSSSAVRKNFEVFYEDTQKGLIVQMLLIRWWYAFDWPLPSEYTGKPPPGYEELDGMMGVYVSMNLEDLGNIVDLRNKDMCPSLSNMSSKSTAELKELCIKAYQGQIAQLVESEGGGDVDTPAIIHLKKEMRHINKINPEEADAEAKRFTGVF
jgi:hypothetical protein